MTDEAKYNVNEAAERLAIGRSHAYDLIRTGALGCYRYPGTRGGARPTIRVGESHLRAFLQGCEQPAGGRAPQAKKQSNKELDRLADKWFGKGRQA